MSTARDVIKRSLRLLGVLASGESPTADQSKDALETLNVMIDQWNLERLMIYQIKNEIFDITAGTTDYTIGPVNSGATWESAFAVRPMILQKAAAFLRANTSGLATDYAMEYWPNDRFQSIFQKQIKTNYPYAWTYDYAYPISTIRIYPQPTQNLQFGLSSTIQLQKFDNLSDYLEFPPGYELCLGYNLAIEIAPEYGLEASATIVTKASEYKANIKRVNSEPVLMTSDKVLLTHGIYNIYGDR
jgi:hypothetical protein